MICPARQDTGTIITCPLGTGFAGTCAVSQQTVLVPDAYSDPRFNPAIDKKTYFRSYKHFSRLSELVKRVKGLEKRLAELEAPLKEEA